MKTLRTLTLAVAATAAMAAPAFADVVVLGGGRSTAMATGVSSQQPTYYLNLENAFVLPEGLNYLSAGAGRANVAGQAINYARGLGNGGELSVLAGLSFTPSVGANVGVGYKQQFVHTGGFAAAVNGSIAGTGLGAGNLFALQVGVPLTFGTDALRWTVDPRVNFPALNTGLTAASIDVPVGLQAPILPRIAILAQVTPGFLLSPSAFSLGGGLGFRFSPTDTAHVDIGLGNVSFVPSFGTAIALSTAAHVGF